MSGDKLIVEAMQIESALNSQIQELGLIRRKISALLDRKGRLTMYERERLANLLRLAKGEPNDEHD